MEFDRTALAELLQRSKGERSINRFGHEAGVDPGYLSRLLRCLTPTPPGAAILSRIAGRASGGVTVEQLMCAAGYLTALPDHLTAAPEQGMAEAERGRRQADGGAGGEARERPNLLLVFEQLRELSDDKLLRVLKMIRMIREMGD